MKTVVRAILLGWSSQQKVLLGKRMRNKGIGQWALVGGKPNEGETLEAAAMREVKEEVDVDFTPHLFKDFVTQLPGEPEPWRVVIFYGFVEGKPVPKEDEISEVGFFAPEEFENLNIAFNHREILNEFFRK